MYALTQIQHKTWNIFYLICFINTSINVYDQMHCINVSNEMYYKYILWNKHIKTFSHVYIYIPHILQKKYRLTSVNLYDSCYKFNSIRWKCKSSFLHYLIKPSAILVKYMIPYNNIAGHRWYIRCRYHSEWCISTDIIMSW